MFCLLVACGKEFPEIGFFWEKIAGRVGAIVDLCEKRLFVCVEYLNIEKFVFPVVDVLLEEEIHG